MEVRAIAKNMRVQPRKVRIIADEVRGKDANRTASVLRYHSGKSARLLRKVLVSAIANAQENHGLDPENLRIAEIRVDEGRRLKRLRARAQGRGNRIIKKSSHITVVVEDVEPTRKPKPHGTKAKPRPTFATPAPKASGRKKKAEQERVAEAESVVETTAEAPVETPAAEATPTAPDEEPKDKGAE